MYGRFSYDPCKNVLLHKVTLLTCQLGKSRCGYAFCTSSKCIFFIKEKSNPLSGTLCGGYGTCLRPRSCGTPPWDDNFKEGTTTPSQTAGAVRGDRHGPLRNQVLCHLLKTLVFTKLIYHARGRAERVYSAKNNFLIKFSHGSPFSGTGFSLSGNFRNFPEN